MEHNLIRRAFYYCQSIERACAAGDEHTVRFLLKNGEYSKGKLNDWFLDAATWGRLGVVRCMVEKGVDVQIRENCALRWAARNGHLKVVQYLAENGADIHASKEGALCNAAGAGRLDVVQYLIEEGADMYVSNGLPRRWAAAQDHLDVLRYLGRIHALRLLEE